VSDTSTNECLYRVSTTYDRTVTVLATSFDDARIAGESRVVALLRADRVHFAPSRVRAISIEMLVS
jgi:hypothetical protein